MRISSTAVLLLLSASPAMAGSNEEDIAQAEARLQPALVPGTSTTEVRMFLDKQGLRYTVVSQEECLKEFQRQQSPPPPPCLGGGYIHIPVPVEKGFSLSFFIESDVLFKLLFNDAQTLERYQVRVAHTGP